MLREMALERMRHAILNFTYRPGDRLVERSLCERLGVSRTVVREVLRYLEAEGLVEVVPHHGPAVARPDPGQAAEIYEIRALLEADAARACATKATPDHIARMLTAIDRNEAAFALGDSGDVLKGTYDFYETLFECAQKRVAWGIVKPLNARINHLRAMTISTPARGMAAIAEMRRIVAAIDKGDADAAYAASMDHVRVAAGLAQVALKTMEEQSAGKATTELPPLPRRGRGTRLTD